MSDSQKLLQSYKIRITPLREQVLNLFLEHRYALSKQQIEKQCMPLADRITLYRTIKTLLSSTLIHIVPDESGQTKYALSYTNNEEMIPEYPTPHAHFKCTICLNTLCLQTIAMPAILLPEGFKLHNHNHLITGICNQCNNDHKSIG